MQGSIALTPQVECDLVAFSDAILARAESGTPEGANSTKLNAISQYDELDCAYQCASPQETSNEYRCLYLAAKTRRQLTDCGEGPGFGLNFDAVMKTHTLAITQSNLRGSSIQKLSTN